MLDSVSSPITKRVYNLGLDEFFAWYEVEPRPGFTKGHRECLARRPEGPWAGVLQHQRFNKDSHFWRSNCPRLALCELFIWNVGDRRPHHFAGTRTGASYFR